MAQNQKSADGGEGGDGGKGGAGNPPGAGGAGGRGAPGTSWDAFRYPAPVAKPLPILYVWAAFALILAILAGAGGEISRVFVTSPSICEVAGSVPQIGSVLNHPAQTCLVVGKVIINCAALAFFGGILFLGYAAVATFFGKR